MTYRGIEQQPRRDDLPRGRSRVGVAGIIAVVMCATGVPTAWAQPPCGVSAASAAAHLNQLLPDERANVEVFWTASQSVVQIITTYVTTPPQTGRYNFPGQRAEPTEGHGSGFFWDEQGYVVTNAHVVRGGSSFSVVRTDECVNADGQVVRSPTRHDAALIGGSAWHDLAVLKIQTQTVRVSSDSELLQNARPIRAVTIGDSHALQVGQRVYAIGSPFEPGLGLAGTLSTGVITGLRRNRRVGVPSRPDGIPLSDMIQTNASINPGNSGGPLLDSRGRLVGVVTSTKTTADGPAETLNFSIPAHIVSRVVPELIETGVYSRPRIGGCFAAASPDPPGVFFLLVRRAVGEPCEAHERPMGLHAGDVIQEIGLNERQANSIVTVDDLWRVLDYYRAGDEVMIKFVREGNEYIVSMTLWAGSPNGDPLNPGDW